MSGGAAASAPLGAGVRHLVIIAPSWVGDTAMATPALAALRRHLPEARLTALVRPGLEEVLAGLETIDEIAVGVRHGALAPFANARRLRALGADAALLLPNSFRSALAVRLASIPRRVGWRRDGRGVVLTHALEPPHQRPIAMVEHYRLLASAVLGVEIAPEPMRLAVTDAQRRAAAALLDGIEEGRPLVVLNPGANRADKRWPAERFAAAGDELVERHGVAIAVTGGPAEAELAAAVVRAAAAPVVDLVQRGVTLGSLKGVLARSALLITNDTGPRHLAAALDTPVVALFGPTDHRWTALPGARERVLLAEPFLPDELLADDHRQMCRIERITVADVVAAASSLLGAAPG